VPRAIDVHVHPSTAEYLTASLGHFKQATERHFNTEIPVRSVEEMADEFRRADVLGVLLAWDAETHSGLPPVTNDFVARCVADHPDAFVGFASVDPHKGAAAVDELRRAVTDLGLKGLKLHPSAQGFAPNSPLARPVLETAAELGIPVLCHTGTTGLGVGLAGGGGIKLGLSRPWLLDEVAAEIPELRIIAAHVGWPWTDELLAVAQHKTNVWIDLSGWSPRRWTEPFRRAVLGPLRDRVLFGTDYPFITHQQWFDAFATHDVDPETQEAILRGNAARLLDL
jgi:hypothetical protein